MIKISRYIVLIIIIAITIVLFVKLEKNINRNEISCVSCNVIIISIDPLRADNIHYYGYNKRISPNIDALAEQSIVFLNSYSTSSWTLPSTMSIFTGLYPSKHKVLNKFTVTNEGSEKISNLNNLSPAVKTIAEILSENGYQTAGFTGGAALNQQFGFNSGFQTYTDQKDFAGIKVNFNKGIDWLKKQKQKKFFLFIHGFDLHGQFIPEGGYDYRYSGKDYKGKLNGSIEEQKALREEALYKEKIDLTKDDVQFIRSLYDEKLNRVDELLGRFISDLKQEGLYNSTVIVLVSSHGEEIYDHERIDHGHSLYQELIHIPFLIKIPGAFSKNIKAQISLIDFLPTLLDLLRIDIRNNKYQRFDGKSILPFYKLKDQPIYSETDYRYAVSKRSLITPDGWKIIYDLEKNEYELYYLLKDPQEKTNLAKNNEEKLSEMSAYLKEFLN